MYLIIVVWSVKHFTCSIEGELHMKSILCDTPNLRCTRCQQNAQHLTVIRAFILDGLVLLTEVKIVESIICVIMKLNLWLVQIVAEMTRNHGLCILYLEVGWE